MKLKPLELLNKPGVLVFLFLAALWLFVGWQPEQGYFPNTGNPSINMSADIFPIWSHPAFLIPRLLAVPISWQEVSLALAYMAACCAIGFGWVVRPIFMEERGELRLCSNTTFVEYIFTGTPR